MVEVKTPPLQKGDEVWSIREGAWGSGRVDARSRLLLKHGVVVGGGVSQVIIQWDGTNQLDRRRRGNARFPTTREQALANYALRLDSLVRINREEAESIVRLRGELEELSNAS